MIAPSAGPADGATAGSTIAEPLSPLGAQFSNPAGLAGFTDRAMGGGLGFAYGRGEVTADSPAGYHAENEVLVPFLNSFLVVPWGRWTFGIATMGTSGARFDYGARPALGVDDGFFSESGMLGLPIGAAYRVSDALWIGGQIIPLYGTTHLRYSREVSEFPGAPTPFRFTVSGLGVQGMVGMTWRHKEAWSVGFSVKPPGRVWTEGDTRLGTGKQDVNLEIEVPTEVALGVTRALGRDWKASYGVRFVDTSVLARSYLRFEDTPSANMPFLSGARDEWRHAIGVQYRWSDSLMLMSGVAKANGIVSNKGVSPSSYDSKDWRLNTGLRWKGEAWMLDAAFGYVFKGSRRVSAEDARVFPGKFESKPAYLLSFVITKNF
ncbi:MAG: OmpP1/FadL family transporter [Candidatus Binatia bacterium]